MKESTQGKSLLNATSVASVIVNQGLLGGTKKATAEKVCLKVTAARVS